MITTGFDARVKVQQIIENQQQLNKQTWLGLTRLRPSGDFVKKQQENECDDI